ncbi:GNAT family N-acetyltransferase [Chelatococcus sp. GCM10030263]|uniref:GNAT family N-acetyltransferase n=1 Tax=Chelatococcus sp. GCM10030263 TaxID=3273387 RepID=UPI00361A9387
MVAIRVATEADLGDILAIYNDAVLTTTAIWNETPADLESRRAILADRRAKGYPFLVAEAEGRVVGYASFGDFRLFEGYRHTVEHSVYVAADQRGRGIAKSLMPPLIDAARDLGKHVMVAGIEAGNAPSIRLHEHFGFETVGHMREVGTKFGRWLDLVLMQKIL